MIQDYFDEAMELITDAKAGRVQPSLYIVDVSDYPNLSTMAINEMIRIGMGVYAIIFGPPGVGKTSFVDSVLVQNPMYAAILTDGAADAMPKAYITYFAMERSPIDKFIKFMAYYMMIKHNNLIDVPTLLQWPNKKRNLTDKDIDQARGFQAVVDHVKKYLDMQSGAKTPAYIKDYLTRKIQSHGHYVTADADKIYINGKEYGDFCTPDGIECREKAEAEGLKIIDDGDKRKRTPVFTAENGVKYKMFRVGGDRIKKIYQGGTYYFARDPQEVLMSVTDTVNKLRRGRRDTTLDVLNEHSWNMADFRDVKALAPIDVCQMDKDSLKSLDGKRTLLMSMGNIKGTGDFAQNMDIAFSLINPKYFGLNSWGPNGDEYDVARIISMGGAFRILQCVKNSYGLDSFIKPCLFIGQNGYFHELPPGRMTEEDYRSLQNRFFPHKGGPGGQLSIKPPVDLSDLPF